MKEEYYTSFRDELLARRERILSLTQQSKIKGDYSEALVREFVRKHISNKYKVGHGLVYDDHRDKLSCECDFISSKSNLLGDNLWATEQERLNHSKNREKRGGILQHMDW